MQRSFNVTQIFPWLLVALLLATFPSMFFIYLGLLVFLTIAFVVICCVDYVRQTNKRKPAGLVLAGMFLTAIISLLGIYGMNCL